MTETIPGHVSISNKKEREFWCRYFSCSANNLREAINKIGTCTEEVKLYLRKKPGKKGMAFWTEFLEKN